MENNCMRPALLLLPMLLATVQLSAERDCRHNRHLVGACTTIHGRAWIAQGGPSLRIWHVGTKHFYGLKSDDPLDAPEPLLDALDSGNNDVYADFELCPFTREISGAMTMVCIQSVDHMVFTEHDSMTLIHPQPRSH
jgi:hypothetical protein